MKINALGDSIVNGFGVIREHSFVNVDDPRMEVNNYGENGTTSLITLSRVDRKLNCDILFVYVGINDFLSGYSLKSVCRNILKIADMAKAKNIPVIISAPHDIAEDATDGWCNDVNYISAKNKLKEFRDFIVVASEEYDFYYIDFYNELKSVSNYEKYEDLFFDGVHPNNKTHDIMRKIFYENILKVAEENELL